MSDKPYNIPLAIRATEDFTAWLKSLDRSLRIRVDQRIQRIEAGHLGQCNRFSNLLEIKWRKGGIGSYRIYSVNLDGLVMLLGGHKDSQRRDILKAQRLLEGVKNGTIRIKIYETVL